jgi:Tfp pilus assembly protein PilX
MPVGPVHRWEGMNAKSSAQLRNVRRIAGGLRAERGFALPTTLLMLIAAFAIVSVGVASTVSVQRGTVRDQSTKSAVQLAETAVSQAMLHFNRIKPSPTNACSPVSSTGPSAGWCPAITTTDPAGGTYTYQARICDSTGSCPPAAGKPAYSLEVVGTGTRGNVIRRVDVRSHSASGQAMFGDYQVKAGDGITLDSNARIHAGTATNGDIILSSNAKQCGQASVGVGHQFQQAGSNSYFQDANCVTPNNVVGQQQINLPPVNQGDVAINNSNSRFFALDPASGNKASACWSGKNANGSNGSCGTRHLAVGTNSTVTLGGLKPYSFCKLTMDSNSSLLVQAGQPVAIYFDSPENCGYSSGVPQLDMDSNTRISSNDGQPVQLLFVGSTSQPPLQTVINLSSNTDINAACEQNFVVYAPRTDINLNSNSTYCGALAGKTLHLDSNADIRTNGASQSFVVPNVAAHYQVDRFVECTATTMSPPSSGC